MKMARELAGHGHRTQMIESVLAANGYHEAWDFHRAAAYDQRASPHRRSGETAPGDRAIDPRRRAAEGALTAMQGPAALGPGRCTRESGACARRAWQSFGEQVGKPVAHA
jgi:hypothetical protein